MSKGTLNKVLLIGNLGADPDVRTTPGGTVVASLNLATSERRKDGQTGNWQDHTEWHRVSVFGRTAETARDYLRKGSKVLIEGSMQTRKWQDKNGQDQYRYEIRAEDMQLMDRAEGAGRAGGGAGRTPAPPPNGTGGLAGGGGGHADWDDEIPF